MAMMNKKIKGKKVIVRVDFNVPLDENRKIHGAKTILVSHLGRPKEGFEEKYSMAPTAVRLGELLGKEVIMAKDVIGRSFAFAKELASMAEIYVNDAHRAHASTAGLADYLPAVCGVCGNIGRCQGFLKQRDTA